MMGSVNASTFTFTKYLDFKTGAGQGRSYQGIVRHQSLAEDPLCGADGGLSATAILIVG
ncbi:MAG: hypothetical protein J7J19_05125 [Thaumarchaeota archaeon]|nr:hypothetical protein [Nitrososphaerota archaeon]